MCPPHTLTDTYIHTQRERETHTHRHTRTHIRAHSTFKLLVLFSVSGSNQDSASFWTSVAKLTLHCRETGLSRKRSFIHKLIFYP